MTGLMDDPNKQAVGLEPSWGGAGDETAEPKAEELTKAQLLEKAAELGVDADQHMTKAEIQAAIDEGG